MGLPANFDSLRGKSGTPFLDPPSEAPDGLSLLSGHLTNSMVHPARNVNHPSSSAYPAIYSANGAVSNQPPVTAATFASQHSESVIEKGRSRAQIGLKVRNLLKQLRGAKGKQDPQEICAQWKKDVDGKVTLLLPDGKSASDRLEKVWQTWSLLSLAREEHELIQKMRWSIKGIIDFLEYTHGERRQAVMMEQCTPQMGSSGSKSTPSWSVQQRVSQTRNFVEHKRRQAEHVTGLLVRISSDDFFEKFTAIDDLSELLADIDEVTGLIRTELLDLFEITSLSLPKKAEEGA
ncbi:hypothetical protein QFC24_004592 [Naganishia onofrii]|uniref:Uncharacterized protein n=1 Tax=Naganishia onofrii TaxID=1851511 RepID=A0ACC2XF37_9TREE|nr:hypothetical protein QFC24_004592 [Naganishia onofrii]